MTVHKNAFSHVIKAGKVLANHEYFVVIRARQVLPEPVESSDSVRLKRLRIVRKSYLVMDAIRTYCMLTWLLQVDNDADVHSEHRLYDIVLLHFASAGPL